MEMEYEYPNDLFDVTGHESGAILYPDGSIFIGSWIGTRGIPIQFTENVWVNWYKIRYIRRIPTPRIMKVAMNEYEVKMGHTPSKTGFKSWLINDEFIVTTQEFWA